MAPVFNDFTTTPRSVKLTVQSQTDESAAEMQLSSLRPFVLNWDPIWWLTPPAKVVPAFGLLLFPRGTMDQRPQRKPLTTCWFIQLDQMNGESWARQCRNCVAVAPWPGLLDAENLALNDFRYR